MSTKLLIIVSVLVFSLAIFLGFKNDHTEETKAEPKKETKIEKKEEMHVYEEEKEEAAPPKGAASQDENYSKETLDQTKKLAMDFVKVFHEFDAAKPLQNVENSKQYMNEELYSNYLKNPSRGTLNAVKKHVLEMNVTQVSNTAKDKIIWNVIVQSENIDSDGNKNQGEDWYLVRLQKENDQYKVTGVSVNAAH